MRLTRLELQSFRAFDHATIQIPTSGVLLVAGANNSGKTALLSAIDAIGGGNFGPETQHYGSEDPSEILAVFALDESDRKRLLEKAGANIPSNEFQEVHWTFQVSGTSFVPVRVSIPWSGRGNNVILAQLIIQGMAQHVQRSSLATVLSGQQSFAETSLDSVELSTGWTPPESGGFRAYNTRAGLGAFLPLADYLNSWISGVYHFNALRPGTLRDSHAMGAAERLSPTGENLSEVLNFLYHNRRETYNELDRLLQQIVPDIGQLQLPIEGGQIRISFRAPDVPTHMLNIKNLGTGVEQLLMTLVVGLMGDGPSAVLIEEPETNLHPGAQRALLTLIREWSASKTFIITTHSPVFLDTSQRTEVVLITRHSGDSYIRSLGPQALEALDELGVRLSDVLSADRILLVEGTTDEEVFKIWFPQHLTNPRVALIPAGGGDNARYAWRLQAWLTEADRLGDRRVLYLRDRDELPEVDIKNLETGGFVKIPLRRELENYLLDETVLAQMIQKRTGSELPVAADVAQVMRQVADRLKHIVVLKRVCKELRPVRLMDYALQGDLAQQQAGLTELQAAVAERIASADKVKDQIAALWRKAEREVDTAWEERWQALAPGEEILKGLWKHYGPGNYSKMADGRQIASAMAEPPEELKQILETFIDQSGT